MSEPQSSPVSDSPANRKKARQIPRRVPLSCLPCRRHKLRCDRQTPCTTCSRYHREEQCLLNPAPARGRKNTGVPLTTGTNAGNVATGLNATSEQARTSLPSVSTHQDESAATNVILNGLQQGLPRMSPARRPEGGNEQLDHNIQGLLPVQPHSRPQGESGQLVDNIHMAAAVQSMTTRYHRDTTSSLHYDAAGDLASVNHPPCVLFPQSLPLFQFASLDGSSALDMVVSSDQEVQWKRLLVKFLPTRTQSDILLTYFIEHINWIFQTVHVPTFRKEYSNFWDAEIEEADLIWMSLLFTIISLSALYVPGDIVELVGMQRGSIRQYADTWHRVSRQALQAGGFEEKPTLTQLQTFSVTQLYWIAANNIETLNSQMGQAIRNAQALGLHKDCTTASNVHEEMRHRLWWDLVDSDTFQSICLGRPPLIQVHLWNVPLPLNCNDVDLGKDFARPHPMNEPTAMSMHIYRARVFQLINKALVSDPSQFRSYDSIVNLDRELVKVMDDLPWYFQLEAGRKAKLFPAAYDFLPWQHHILRTCVSTQRIRMYRPFLADQTNDSFNACIAAVEDALTVYRTLRDDKPMTSQPKFYAQAYQIFSVAVTLAALLLVERTIPQAAQFRVDIQTMATDLEVLEAQASPVPVAVNGRSVLLKMIKLFEQGDSCSPEDAERLVPAISTILGGESSTRAYLGRRTTQGSQHQSSVGQATPATELRAFAQGQEYHDVVGSMENVQTDDRDDLPFDPMIEPGEGMFDFDEFQLADSYGLFGWDMTGLLSDASASILRPP